MGAYMNLGSVLKQEISRVARKEIRSEVQPLKKASSQHRSDIAALKRRVADLEKMVKQLSKGKTKQAAVAGSQGETGTVARFSGKGLAAQRKRLGLSAADFGKLIGVSGASVYLWEKGETRPRAGQMAGIAAVRAMGKKEAAEKLAGVESE